MIQKNMAISADNVNAVKKQPTGDNATPHPLLPRTSISTTICPQTHLPLNWFYGALAVIQHHMTGVLITWPHSAAQISIDTLTHLKKEPAEIISINYRSTLTEQMWGGVGRKSSNNLSLPGERRAPCVMSSAKVIWHISAKMNPFISSC